MVVVFVVVVAFVAVAFLSCIIVTFLLCYFSSKFAVGYKPLSALELTCPVPKAMDGLGPEELEALSLFSAEATAGADDVSPACSLLSGAFWRRIHGTIAARTECDGVQVRWMMSQSERNLVSTSQS